MEKQEPGHGELVPSEELTRTRRNYLFAIALVLLLAVFVPNGSIKVPGFDAVTIDVRAALILGLAAASFYFYEYMLEHRLTRMRNTEILRPADPEDREKRFDSSLRRTKDEITAVGDGIKKVATPLGSEIAKLNDLLGRVQFEPSMASFQSVSEKIGLLLNSIGKDRSEEQKFAREQAQAAGEALGSAMLEAQNVGRAVRENVERVVKVAGDSQEQLVLIRRELEKMNHGITEVAQFIYRFQEQAFFWKDWALTTALLTSAFPLVIYRVVTLPTTRTIDSFALIFGAIGPVVVVLWASVRRRKAPIRPSSG